MRVHDDRIGDEHELAARFLPPLAELAVLAAGQREGLVEPPAARNASRARAMFPDPKKRRVVPWP